MTRESKAGLLMITMLIGVFGFMVYQKMHQPLEAKAQQAPSRIDDADRLREDSDQPLEATSEFEAPKRRDRVAKAAADDSSTRPRKNANPARSEHRAAREDLNASKEEFPAAPNGPAAFPEEDEADRDQSGERPNDPFHELPVAQSRSVPRLPTQIPENDDTDSAPIKKPETKRVLQPPRMAAAEPNRDSFGDPVQIAPSALPRMLPTNNDDQSNMNGVRRDRTERVNAQATAIEPKTAVTKANRNARTIELETSASRQTSKSVDIDEPNPRTSKRQPEVIMAQAEQDPAQLQTPRNVPDRDIDPFADEATQKPMREAEQPTRAFENQPAALNAREDQPGFSSPTRENPRRNARPAPAARIDEDFSSLPSAPGTLDGDTYKIEPDDNFWNISRKKYGTGRYFMALAKHNSRTVPDPQRMKPGTIISTPTPKALERTYAQLIPRPAASESTGGPIQTASAASVQEVDTQGAFYVGRDGTPMYRVGSGDTLGAIAQRHLGRASRYVQIFKLNQDILTDDKTLSIGMELRLPADASRVEVVGNGKTYR